MAETLSLPAEKEILEEIRSLVRQNKQKFLNRFEPIGNDRDNPEFTCKSQEKLDLDTALWLSTKSYWDHITQGIPSQCILSLYARDKYEILFDEIFTEHLWNSFLNKRKELEDLKWNIRKILNESVLPHAIYPFVMKGDSYFRYYYSSETTFKDLILYLDRAIERARFLENNGTSTATTTSRSR